MTGGGGRVNGGGGQVVLTRMQPVDTNNQDRYDVTAIESGDASSWSVQAFAVCATLSDIQIRSTTSADGGRTFRSVIAGCPAGTERVGDINPGGGNADPTTLTVHGDALYFAANDGTSGIELWALDVAAPETVLDSGPGEGEHGLADDGVAGG